MTTATPLDQLCINTLRTLAIDSVQKANSGHPGLPMGAAPMAYELWQHHLKHNPASPDWPDRDRFVLSAGHGSMLLYALLHVTGYDVSLDDLKAFRQWGSRTPGHPESFETKGVEATTGPLGQGAANAVGMAIAERALAHRFNRSSHEIVNHYTYALVSDGDLMEGVAAEAASVAGQLGLSKLVYLYDQNDVTLDGPASLAFSVEDVQKRYEAYGFQVLRVEDGDHDIEGIRAAIAQAKENTTQPSLISIHTTIGFGSPNRQGTAKAHGAPLGPEEMALTKKALDWDPEQEFLVPDEAREHFRAALSTGDSAEADWNDRFAAYRTAHPELAAEWDRRFAGVLPADWDDALPRFGADDKLATREASGKVLNAVAETVPELMGGDADLSSSTKTALADAGSFEGAHGSGRNIHFGVREHAMGSIVNGMAYHGGVRGYASTFFVFSDYMRPAVRIAALSKLPAIYVWTHDSVGVGEDGPTHQPVEHLMSLRAIPNLHVIRPADANETREAWRAAMSRTTGPTALVLTRQKLPTFGSELRGDSAELSRGAYVLADEPSGEPDAILIATGSEVPLCLEARALLASDGVRCRVVSMPCWELFEEQDDAYREAVLPGKVLARVSVEAGVSLGWSRYTGTNGSSVAVDRFGASAPAGRVFEELGFTPEAVAAAVKQQI